VLILHLMASASPLMLVRCRIGNGGSDAVVVVMVVVVMVVAAAMVVVVVAMVLVVVVVVVVAVVAVVLWGDGSCVSIALSVCLSLVGMDIMTVDI